MNRAILIVICDFLVSAMLSMMTGMVPAHTGGTGVGLDEQTTRALLAEMHENLSQLERVRELLREAVRKNGGATAEQDRQLRELAEQIVALRRNSEMLKSAKDGKNLAKLTAKELRQRLEAELRERMRAEMELKEQRLDLADREKQLRELRDSSLGAMAAQTKISENLSRSNAELVRRNEEAGRRLEQSREELRRIERELGEEKSRRKVAEGKLDAAEGRLGVAEARMREREREFRSSRDDLAKAKKALEDMNAKSAKNKSDSEQNRARLIATRRELNKSEKDRAKMRDEIARDSRTIRQLELQVAELTTARKEQEAMLKRGISDLQKARKDLEEERIRLAQAESRVREQEKRLRDKDNTIKVATTQLAEANKKLRNRVLQSYGEGAVKLTVDIREELMLGREQRSGGVFYLPFVEQGGRTFIVGHTNQLLGDLENTSMSFRDVIRASLSVSIPGAKSETPLTMPVLLSRREPRLAAIPVRLVGRKAIRTLTAGELRDNGVDGLFLFKAGSPGNDYAELSGRCSIGISGDLFIRNSGSRSELRAEPGDFILTRSGEFVGMVTAVEEIPGSRRHGDQVRATVMPDQKSWDDPQYTFAFTKPRGAKYFTDFQNSVTRIREGLQPRQRRRRH